MRDLNWLLPIVLATGTCLGSPGQGSLIITDEGVGPIDAGTPFDVAGLRELFPSYAVIEGTSSTEGEEFSVIRIMDDQHELLVVNPSEEGNRIFSVVTRSPAVQDSFGGGIGATYGETFDEREAEGCVPGMEEYSGTVSCPAPGSSRVRYIFRGSWSGPDGVLPPLEELKSWTISEIAWLP